MNTARKTTSGCLKLRHNGPLAVTAVLAALAPAARAADNPVELGLDSLRTLGDLLGSRRGFDFVPASQGEFDRLSGDLMAAVDPRSAGAGQPLGHGRWSISVSGDRTATEDPSLWALASDRERSELLAPRLALAVGVGSRLNLELAGMRLPGSETRLINLAATLALAGDAAIGPHLVLRASLGRLSGIEDVRVRTGGLELLASRRYGAVTAYAGAGAVFGRGHYDGDVGFRSRQTLGKWFVGAETGIGSLRAGLEAGLLDDRAYQGLRISYLF